jgi:uracil-DNA glycosylase
VSPNRSISLAVFTIVLVCVAPESVDPEPQLCVALSQVAQKILARKPVNEELRLLAKTITKNIQNSKVLLLPCHRPARLLIWVLHAEGDCMSGYS